tara:strand:- start:1096 stop:2151 length:1056 start_codon:yes stop_codon:yes gene_type:complete
MSNIGWYDKQNNFYNNKWVCENTNDHKDIRFVFLEDYDFIKLDWTVEPKESLDFLLAERAKQLRDRYDYIRFWYSSGSDSETVLQSFIKNNVFIDEIVSVAQGSSNNLETLESDREIQRRAIPNLKRKYSALKGTKITILKADHNDYKRVLSHQDFQLISGDITIRPMHYPSTAYFVFPQLQEVHNKYSNVCNLIANMKPRLHKINNIFYTYHYDTEVSRFLLAQDIDFFYTSSDFPKLHLKQLHVLKNYFKFKYPDTDEAEIHESSVYKYDIEDATRVKIDRSIDWLKHDPDKKDGFSAGVTILKVRQSVKEFYENSPELYDMFKSLTRTYKRQANNEGGIKSKTYCLGS